MNDRDITRVPITKDTVFVTGGISKDHIVFKDNLPKIFKKNDTVKFKHGKKLLSGAVIKIGDHGVDVKCNGLFYYCYYWCEVSRVFKESNKTKNYR